MDESIKAPLNQNVNRGHGGKKVVINGREITLGADIMNLINRPATLEAVKVVKERYGLGLKEAKDVVEQVQGVPSESSSDKGSLNQNVNRGHGGKKVVINGREITLGADIMNLINSPAQLEAIKAVKERYGLGLKEAKDVVDQVQGVPPGLSSGKGCMITLLFLFFLSTNLMSLIMIVKHYVL